MNATERPLYGFDVPQHTIEETGSEVTSFGMIELTGKEQIHGSRRGGTDGLAITFELAQEALREVNGQPVSRADGTEQDAWEKMPAKVRELCVQGYQDIHEVSKEDTKLFLASRTMKTMPMGKR